MSAITVGGDLVHYEVLGRGRSVILLHGWLGSWRYWIPTMRILQLKYRVYAIDLFGYGDSSKNQARYSIVHQVNIVTEFMKQLGIPKTALIGHGLGAQVAAEFAAQYPDKVARMMLISAPLFNPGNLDKRPVQGRMNKLTTDTTFDAETIARRMPPSDTPDPSSFSEATIPSASNKTVGPNAIDRDKLRQEAQLAALARGESALRGEDPREKRPVIQSVLPDAGMNDDNALSRVLNQGIERLMAVSIKRGEVDYKSIQSDITKMDEGVLQYIASGFDAGRLLDTLRLSKVPTIILHGKDDLVIPLPVDDVWLYLTEESGRELYSFPLEGARHFPMIEHEPFLRLVAAFLESQHIGDVEPSERWMRRTR